MMNKKKIKKKALDSFIHIRSMKGVEYENKMEVRMEMAEQNIEKKREVKELWQEKKEKPVIKSMQGDEYSQRKGKIKK